MPVVSPWPWPLPFSFETDWLGLDFWWAKFGRVRDQLESGIQNLDAGLLKALAGSKADLHGYAWAKVRKRSQTPWGGLAGDFLLADYSP